VSAFTLDTSGAVATPWALYREKIAHHALGWSNLSPFEQGYTRRALEELQAALFADPGNYLDGGEGVEYIGPYARFSDLSPSALERIVRDCGEMVAVLPPALRTEKAGRDWWRARQAGVATLPPLTVSLGDAGKVTLADRVPA
jgi:hypothetical protein